jgi:NADH:ubiquinone oxidoreductase subunit
MVAPVLDIAVMRWHEPGQNSGPRGRTMSFKTFLIRFLTWWNSQTFGTQVWTSLYGELVGEDEYGNRYYRAKTKNDPALGYERRWVIYNGDVEASRVPPSWHGWLHGHELPPTEEKVVERAWWKPHRPNLTGTPGAYRPAGSTLSTGRRPPATGDYKAWTPGS